MSKYRLRNGYGTHSVPTDDGRETVEPGDVIELTEEEADAFGYKFSEADDSADVSVERDIETADTAAEDEDEDEGGNPEQVRVTDDAVEQNTDPLGASIDADAIVEQNASPLKSAIERGDYDDDLGDLRTAEESDNSRKTVLEAIDERQDEITSDNDESDSNDENSDE